MIEIPDYNAWRDLEMGLMAINIVMNGQYVDKLEKRVDKLEDTIVALCEKSVDPIDWARPVPAASGPVLWYCRHCDRRAEEWPDIQHQVDCPIKIAKTLIDSGEAGKENAT